MRVVVVGTGYVGLVSGTCFAEMGNQVVCIDIDSEKITRMQSGEVPIYEPGLHELFKRNTEEGRLSFTTKLAEGVRGAKVIFLALPTPEKEDGSADLSYILSVARNLGPLHKEYAVIVDKSTVPVGTAKKVTETILKSNPSAKFDVVSNPEFLREGQAVSDFMSPERVVIGSTSDESTKIMRSLYEPFVNRNPEVLMVMDKESAEMVKYAANAMLATRISFMNEIARVCEAVGADIGHVRHGIGSDSRIGSQFLYAGPGYGGSCFPKDVLALDRTARANGVHLGILEAVDKANDEQKLVLPNKVKKYFGKNLKNKTFAVWGLSFKDNTDDVRESPALTLIEELVLAGANIVAFDPEAITNARKYLGNRSSVKYGTDMYRILDGCEALVIATNWKEFSSPDFDKIKQCLKEPIIFDGRNLYDPHEMEKRGFSYMSIGREQIIK